MTTTESPADWVPDEAPTAGFPAGTRVRRAVNYGSIPEGSEGTVVDRDYSHVAVRFDKHEPDQTLWVYPESLEKV